MKIKQHKKSAITLDKFEITNEFVVNNAIVSYTLYGDLDNGKKLALFFHGFSSDSDLHVWWKKFPIQKIVKDYNIICFNSLGSCHGTLGPETINPETGLAYGYTFPKISIHDTVNFVIAALNKMKIEKLDIVFGCSMGGMQVLDMFIRFPEKADKFISVCGSPLPLTTKLINAAQANIVDDGIKKNLSENKLRSRMGLARFFFRLSCTNEKSLAILDSQQRNNTSTLENYFISDSIDYEKCFSPYSYYLYMKMLMNYELDLQDNWKNDSVTEILLISISEDQFTPPACIEKVFNFLKEKNCNVKINQFETNYGHEAWILDGGQFYEFIKNELAA